MEHNKQIDIDFLKGFNEGYMIAKYEPELAVNLQKIISKSSRVMGLKKGQEQFGLEQQKELLPDWLRNSVHGKIVDMRDMDKENEIDLDR